MHATAVAVRHTKSALLTLGIFVSFAVLSPAIAQSGEQVKQRAADDPASGALQLRMAQTMALPGHANAATSAFVGVRLAWREDDCEDDLFGWATALNVPGPTAAVTPTKAAGPSDARKPLSAIDGVQLAMLDSSASRRDVEAPLLAALELRPEPSPATAPAQVAASAVAVLERPVPETIWEITPADKTLNASLSRWAASAGWQLVWELPVDYAVEVRTVVPGSFEEAVGAVARSMASADIPMKAIFYQGNKVLRIVARGVEQ